MTKLFDTNPRNQLIRRTIVGKKVVSFRSHHHAIIPWYECRQQLDQAPRLLSIDYHTDSHLPFLRHCVQEGRAICGGYEPSLELTDEIRRKRIGDIFLSDPNSIDAAVGDLWHDEHIQTALQSDIIDVAFIIAERLQNELLSDQQIEINEKHRVSRGAFEENDFNAGTVAFTVPSKAEPPFTYTIPKSRLVILEDNTTYLNDEEYRAWRDDVIESRSLKERFDLIDTICSTTQIDGFFERPFILDIDLDAFNTRQSISPRDCTVFYDLVRHCEMITIAQEPECVESCQITGENLTADWLESELLVHITRALEI